MTDRPDDQTPHAGAQEPTESVESDDREPLLHPTYSLTGEVITCPHCGSLIWRGDA